SPGKTNVMALRAVRELDGMQVDSVEVIAAGRDREGRAAGQLRPPYALQTLLDELKLEPVVLRDGSAERIRPLSDGGTVDLGPPSAKRRRSSRCTRSSLRSATASAVGEQASGCRWRRRCSSSCGV